MTRDRVPDVEVRVLGPVSVLCAGSPIDIGGPQPSLLLALLVDRLGDAVSTDALVDGLWESSPPASARKAVQIIVSNLRKSLRDCMEIETVRGGYLIDGSKASVDAAEFERLVSVAAGDLDADPSSAAESITAALNLWTGPAYSGIVSSERIENSIVRLSELRLQALTIRFEAALRLGRHAESVGDLEALTTDHPYREDVRRLHMLALYRSGRQTEALRAFQRTRSLLAEELGLEPSADLRALQQQILEQSSDIDFEGGAGQIEQNTTSDQTASRPSARGYELREAIGRGSFGAVYRAYHPSIGREVAVKVVRPELANHPRFVQFFESDAELVTDLEHPHVVALFDHWRDPDGAYLVMPLMRGGKLADSTATPGWEPPAAIRLLDQVGAALSYAHRRSVVHGAVSSKQVLLDADGNGYVSDFGIGRHVIGETGAGHAPASMAGDIAAFARIAHEVLTGVPPDGDAQLLPVASVRPGLPSGLDAVFKRATHADSARRHERIDDVLRAIRRAFGADVTIDLAPQDVPERNPYKGLRAFTEVDAPDFFGRDVVASQLRSWVSRSMLTCVVGPSGSGKSSLVRAGLVPDLRRDGLAPGRGVMITEMFPGAHPFEELEGALLKVAVSRPVDLLADLIADDRGLARAAKQILPDDVTDLVLVIDQFEELFSLTTSEEVRTSFISSLTAVAADVTSRVRLVLTMRADFFDRPLEYAEFGALLSDGLVTVAAPAQSELAEAIVEPARGAGLEIESGLISLITRDVVSEPGALPLMQYALTELAAAREGRLLTIEAYELTGGVAGAVARRAEEIYLGLPPASKLVAQDLFVRLVTVDKDGDDTRRRMRRSELDSLGIESKALDVVLSDFGSFRLLTFDHDPVTRGQTVEVAHEALIREWPRFRGWVDDRREGLLLERRLRLATVEWQVNQRDVSFLFSGGRLEQYESWASSESVRLTDAEREFLDAGHRAEREAARQEERRRRRVLALVGSLAVVALLIAGIAVVQRQQASDSAASAEQAAVEADSLRAIAAEEAAAAQTAATEADSARGEAEMLRSAAERRAAVEAARAATLTAAALAERDPELARLVTIEAAEIASANGATLPETMGALWAATQRDTFAGSFDPVGSYDMENPSVGVGRGIEMLPDGRAVLTTDEFETASNGLPDFDLLPITRLRDIETGESLVEIADPGYGLTAAWDAPLQQIVIVGIFGEAGFWDPETGQEMSRVKLSDSVVFQYASTDDRIMFSEFSDVNRNIAVVNILDRATNEVIARIPNASRATPSPNGRYVAVFTHDETVDIHDFATGELVMQVAHGAGNPFTAIPRMDWIGQSDALWWLEERGTVRRIDVAQQVVEDPNSRVGVGDRPLRIRSSADGRFLAVGDDDRSISLYDAASFELLDVLDGEHTEGVTVVEWSPDLSHLVTMGRNEVVTWDGGASLAAPLAFVSSAEPVRAHAQFGEESLVVAGAGGGGALWDVPTGERLLSFDGSAAAGDVRIAAAENEGIFAVVSAAGLTIYDAAGRLVGGPVQVSDVDNPLAISAAGDLLIASTSEDAFLTGRADRRATVGIDTATGEIVWRTDGILSSDAASVRDGSLIVVAGERGQQGESELLVLDASTGNVIAAQRSGGRVFREIAVSPGEQRVAAATGDGQIVVYDLDAIIGSEKAEVTSITIPTREAIDGVAFLDDGLTLVSGSSGGALRAWNTENLDQLWSVEVGFGLGEVRVRNGLIWFGSRQEVLVGEQAAAFGLLAIPQDQAAFVAAARLFTDAELSPSECAEFFDAMCG